MLVGYLSGFTTTIVIVKHKFKRRLFLPTFLYFKLQFLQAYDCQLLLLVDPPIKKSKLFLATKLGTLLGIPSVR